MIVRMLILAKFNSIKYNYRFSLSYEVSFYHCFLSFNEVLTLGREFTSVYKRLKVELQCTSFKKMYQGLGFFLGSRLFHLVQRMFEEKSAHFHRPHWQTKARGEQ